MGDVNKRLPKEPFNCTMCKKYNIAQYRYVYTTFDFSPKHPSQDLIICEKCAVREGKFKNIKELRSFYEKKP